MNNRETRPASEMLEKMKRLKGEQKLLLEQNPLPKLRTIGGKRADPNVLVLTHEDKDFLRAVGVKP